MDDRCELYGDEWIKGYSDLMGSPAGATRAGVRSGGRSEYKFERAIVMTNPPEKEKPAH